MEDRSESPALHRWLERQTFLRTAIVCAVLYPLAVHFGERGDLPYLLGSAAAIAIGGRAWQELRAHRKGWGWLDAAAGVVVTTVAYMILWEWLPRLPVDAKAVVGPLMAGLLFYRRPAGGDTSDDQRSTIVEVLFFWLAALAVMAVFVLGAGI